MKTLKIIGYASAAFFYFSVAPVTHAFIYTPEQRCPIYMTGFYFRGCPGGRHDYSPIPHKTYPYYDADGAEQFSPVVVCPGRFEFFSTNACDIKNYHIVPSNVKPANIPPIETPATLPAPNPLPTPVVDPATVPNLTSQICPFNKTNTQRLNITATQDKCRNKNGASANFTTTDVQTQCVSDNEIPDLCVYPPPLPPIILPTLNGRNTCPIQNQNGRNIDIEKTKEECGRYNGRLRQSNVEIQCESSMGYIPGLCIYKTPYPYQVVCQAAGANGKNDFGITAGEFDQKCEALEGIADAHQNNEDFWICRSSTDNLTPEICGSELATISCDLTRRRQAPPPMNHIYDLIDDLQISETAKNCMQLRGAATNSFKNENGIFTCTFSKNKNPSVNPKDICSYENSVRQIPCVPSLR